MKHKPKGSGTTGGVRDSVDKTIHGAKGNWIRNQEENKCGIEREFDFQSGRQCHLYIPASKKTMWIVFRDPKNVFLHVDKFVYEIVDSEDIHNYQECLLQKFPGGRKHEIIETATHLQTFFTLADGDTFFVRKFPVWWSPTIPQTTIALLEG